MDRVQHSARTRSVRPIVKDGDELGVEVLVDRPTQDAVHTYRAMLPEELKRGSLVHAAQVMSRPAVVVRYIATAGTAWRVLRDHCIHQTPVVAVAPVTDIRLIELVMLNRGVDGVPIGGESERLLGFVSRSDVLRAVVKDPPLSMWR